MTTRGFCRYDLRTTDPDAARAFYRDALAFDFAAEGSLLAVWPLHEQARARGAPAHWLGFIGVESLDATVARMTAAGAQLLGPPLLRGEDGEAFAIVRDPCEAVVALRESSRTSAPRSIVAWHQLHTRDLSRSWEIYSSMFGWKQHGAIGEYLTFGYSDEHDAGSIGNTARLPGVHPHWLYYFPVADLDVALAKVTSLGGTALAPLVLPNGDRVVACEDPQKAAFGLIQLNN